MRIRLHAFERASRANGPGLRAVVWFQGCTLACPGCFNPDTHDPQGGYETDTSSLAADILALKPRIEGLSISGGEPFQQPEALLDLLERLGGSGLSRLAFSGYTLDEVRALPLGARILSHLDVLIAGRYVASQHLGRGLLGSANQRIHLLTQRHAPGDFTCIPAREAVLHTDGTVTLSGVALLSGIELRTRMDKRYDKLLVLDIDGTLLHASEVPLDREPDFRVGLYYVYKRPGVDELLRQCLEWFEVGVWTSATLDYARCVMNRLLGGSGALAFLWARERCTRRFDYERREHYWIKNLKELKRRGYRLERVIVVDDSAEKLERSYGNHLPITPYRGQPDDRELFLLMKYLPALGSAANVREVEKRWWRARVPSGEVV